MSMTGATLKDVARAAGVHPGTASRALNPSTRKHVSRRTVEAVLAAARDLGYLPDPIARTLRTNRSHAIGVVLPDITNPVFPPAVRGIEDGLREHSYTALVGNTDNDPEREEEVLGAMRGRRVDGFIIGTALREHPFLRSVAEAGTAIVQFSRITDDAGIPAVLVDDAEGMRLAVDHCAGYGHRRLAHLAGPTYMSTGENRRQAFVTACERHGDIVEQVVVECDSYSVEAGARAAEDLLQRSSGCTAILAGNDLIALGAYRVLAEHGTTIPGDVSVIGFNDMPFVDMLQPPLTTVHVPQYHIGVEAARLLLERLRDAEAPAKRLMLPAKLMIRGSTGPAPDRRAPHARKSVSRAPKSPRDTRSST